MGTTWAPLLDAPEEEGEHLARLRATLAAISSARTPGQVVGAVLEHGLAAMGATRAVVSWEVSPGVLQVLHEAGSGGKATADHAASRAADPSPAADAFRTGRPVWLGTAEELRRAYPRREERRARRGGEAWAAVPLAVDGRPVGTLELAFARAQRFTGGERALIEILADRCAQALDRARLLEAARAAEEAARRSERELRSILGLAPDVADREQAEAFLRKREARLALLSRTAGRLLASESPQQAIEELCLEVMRHLECDVFFNYLLDEASGRLHLNACGGVPDDEARRIEWLDLGVAVCGCAARDACRIVAEDIARSGDERAALVRSFGVQAYCAHPLRAGDRVVGTLSFGTRARTRFTEDELELMRSVADQVVTAIVRERSARALCAANARLVEADRRKNDFLAVLSHELRNPLAPIRNSLYVLDRAIPGGDHARRAREVMQRQVTHLSRLVDDLLDVTRVTRNKIALQRERLELNDLVARVAEDQRSLLEQGKVRLGVTPCGAPVPVHGDAARLAQVVSNLLQNAAKFTPPGGAVEVVVERSEDARQAVVRVRDTGVGMAPETVGRLFEPFMQADSTLDRSKGGLGLGLALVKGLVELHDGAVSARSDGLGAGSEFVVRLPLLADAAPEPAGLTAGSRRRPRRRVLVIEDNVDAAETLRDALALGGHEVAVAHDGAEGLARARTFRPEFVVCDIGLPQMDGFAVARALRADDRLRDVHLVAMSGYALPDDVERAIAAGFERHLPKPADPVRIEDVFRELAPDPGSAEA
jgi:signal transduction histidine kinase/ActR/RegA family two-component response regulator